MTKIIARHDIHTHPEIDKITTYLMLEMVECFTHLGLDRLKKDFLKMIGDKSLIIDTKVNQLTGVLKMAAPCIDISNSVQDEAWDKYYKGIEEDVKFKSFGIDPTRPPRGGYGILDQFIVHAYKTGRLKEYTISDVFSMYLIYILINYDEMTAMDYIVSYTIGYTEERRLLHLVEKNYEDNQLNT